MPPKSAKHNRGHSVSSLVSTGVDVASLSVLLSSQSQPQPSTSQTHATSGDSTAQVRPKKRKHDDQLIVQTSDSSDMRAISELQNIVSQQHSELQQLRAIVTQQQDQINSLLSVLGVASAQSSTTGTAPATSPPGEGQGSGSGSDVAVATAAVPGRLYSAVTVQGIPSLSAPLRQAVVAAVYRDMKDHDRRTRNIVINGLRPMTDRPDDALAGALLETEFGVKPDLVKCRRLGKVQPSKIQPLLVTLRADDQAAMYADRARRLRQSLDFYTRHHVFINRDVTRAEA